MTGVSWPPVGKPPWRSSLPRAAPLRYGAAISLGGEMRVWTNGGSFGQLERRGIAQEAGAGVAQAEAATLGRLLDLAEPWGEARCLHRSRGRRSCTGGHVLPHRVGVHMSSRDDH